MGNKLTEYATSQGIDPSSTKEILQTWFARQDTSGYMPDEDQLIHLGINLDLPLQELINRIREKLEEQNNFAKTRQDPNATYNSGVLEEILDFLEN